MGSLPLLHHYLIFLALVSFSVIILKGIAWTVISGHFRVHYVLYSICMFKYCFTNCTYINRSFVMQVYDTLYVYYRGVPWVRGYGGTNLGAHCLSKLKKSKTTPNTIFRKKFRKYKKWFIFLNIFKI